MYENRYICIYVYMYKCMHVCLYNTAYIYIYTHTSQAASRRCCLQGSIPQMPWHDRTGHARVVALGIAQTPRASEGLADRTSIRPCCLAGQQRHTSRRCEACRVRPAGDTWLYPQMPYQRCTSRRCETPSPRRRQNTYGIPQMPHVYICIHMYTYVYIYMCVCMYVCMDVYVYVYVYEYVCMHVFVCIYV